MASISKVMNPEEKMICRLQVLQGFREQTAGSSLKDWITNKTDASVVELELENFPLNIFRTYKYKHFSKFLAPLYT